jgi:hypothetical protein
MYRRRWALACGCVPARSAVTVPRVVHPGGRGKRRSRANGPRSPRRRRGEPSPQESVSALHRSGGSGLYFYAERPGPDRGVEPAGKSYRFFPVMMIGVNPSAACGLRVKGRAAGGAPAARGIGLFLEGTVCRSYRDRSGPPMKLRKTTTTHTEMQTPVIIGVPIGSRELQPCDHSAIGARPRLWNEGHIRIGTLVPHAASLHTEAGAVFEHAERLNPVWVRASLREVQPSMP